MYYLYVYNVYSNPTSTQHRLQFYNSYMLINRSSHHEIENHLKISYIYENRNLIYIENQLSKKSLKKKRFEKFSELKENVCSFNK